MIDQGHPKRLALFSLLASLYLSAPGESSAQDFRNLSPAELAPAVLRDAGLTGGLVVHVGCGEAQLTAALAAAGDALRVHGIDTDDDRVSRARARLREQGRYGVVSIDRFDGTHLPYIDNLVNLLVAEDLAQVSMDEVRRVLAPGGVSYIRSDGEWTKSVKPRPADIDEWTHYLYDASNNAVARDRVVGPPRRLQWAAGPRFSRHHDKMSSMSALVSASGRVFYIFDEAPRVSILLPPEWSLIARDAFNGTLLWKRSIEKWHSHLWPLKNGPAQLPRRLVASGDRVYATLRIDGPVLALDAATGKTIHTYADTESAEEIVLVDDVLLVVTGRPRPEDEARARRRGQSWDPDDWKVMALRADSGEPLWTRKTPALPNTLAADHARVVLHDGERVVCLDRQSGRPLWRSEPVARSEQIRSFYSPTLVLYKSIVLFSGGETAGQQTGSWYREGKDTMTALEADTGKVLWTAPHPPSGYRSAEDLLVADGLVWTGETTSGRAEGLFTGRDPLTGKIVKQFVPDVETYWFHHRCYRGKGTDKFLLMSRTGVEFVNVREEHWETNHFVRGACLYGVMPANGLLYAPQHPCACYLEAKLSGFNALAPAPAKPLPVVDKTERLTKGPAFGSGDDPDPAGDEDWPTFRHDAARSGLASTSVPENLRSAWKTDLGGKLTSPVISGGRVFVATIDTHTVHAVDAASGRRLWDFTAGGRVDSPPTVYRGNVYFGSADGRIYCLRASDGALAWRYLAAPADRRTVSFDQLESVWPLHGSVLIQNDQLYAVSGRSMFLDGGLRLVRLEPRYGKVLSESSLNERDQQSGKELQEFVSWLNMPTGLPDVLSCDGKYVYMRSQPFELDGKRLPLRAMPRSEDADQGAPDPVQGVEHAHIFCPTGFLDDSWWHRSYWMYGTMYVSGWQGYYRAGKTAPAGRILVTDDSTVYGFGRKPRYWRWTTPIEHQLFAAPKAAQASASPFSPERRKPVAAAGTRVRVAKSDSLNPSGRELTLAAWVRTSGASGVVLARGGSSQGYALHVKQGRPVFAVRANQKLDSVTGKAALTGRWTHLAAVLTKDAEMRLYVDGQLAASGAASSLLTADPAEAMEIGEDDGSAVGAYGGSTGFTGLIDEVRVYRRALTHAEILTAADVSTDPRDVDTRDLALYYSFQDGQAGDGAGNGNDGTVEGATPAEGRVGEALKFTAGGGAVPGFQVRYAWTTDLPFYARGMVLAGDTIFVAGPADLIDEEEEASRRATTSVNQARIIEQRTAWAGERGAPLWAVSAADGKKRSELQLDSPPVFNGLAAAGGRLYLTAMDGSVVCLSGSK